MELAAGNPSVNSGPKYQQLSPQLLIQSKRLMDRLVVGTGLADMQQQSSGPWPISFHPLFQVAIP